MKCVSFHISFTNLKVKSFKMVNFVNFPAFFEKLVEVVSTCIFNITFRYVITFKEVNKVEILQELAIES